jgi:DmsE family decaheme c-type cytochrome
MMYKDIHRRCKVTLRKLGTNMSNTVNTIVGNIACKLLLTVACLCIPGIATAQSSNSASVQKTAEFSANKSQACLFCHNLERMRAILDTPHGDRNNPYSPYAQHECESCHGPGSLHVTRLRQNKTRALMIDYGAETKTPLAKQSETCLDNCHEKDMGKLKGMEWSGSVHGRGWVDADGQNKEMSCANCHKLHEKHESLKDRTQQAAVCYKCHEKSEREHPRFEDKGIVFDKLTCWDCHDVHQLIYKESEPKND